MANDFRIEMDDLELRNVFDAKKLSDTADAALKRVKDQHEALLAQGKDPDGASMPPLDPYYAARKRDGYTVTRGKNKGQKFAGTGRDIRDLSLTAAMQISANVKKIPSGAEYGFGKTQVKKARANEERSSFHYVSKSDETVIEDAFSKLVDENLKDVVKIKRSR